MAKADGWITCEHCRFWSKPDNLRDDPEAWGNCLKMGHAPESKGSLALTNGGQDTQTYRAFACNQAEVREDDDDDPEPTSQDVWNVAFQGSAEELVNLSKRKKSKRK